MSEDFIYRYVGLYHGCNVKNSKKSNMWAMTLNLHVFTKKKNPEVNCKLSDIRS